MNNKGSIMVGVVMLIAAVVGIVVVDQVAAPIYTDFIVLNETFTTVYNGTTSTLANDCVSRTGTTAYDWTNGTLIANDNYTIAPGTYPNRVTNIITWAPANFAHNGTTIGVNYTYECSYGSNATFRLVMEYYAVICGVAVLGLAGIWLYMKGGF